MIFLKPFYHSKNFISLEASIFKGILNCVDLSSIVIENTIMSQNIFLNPISTFLMFDLNISSLTIRISNSTFTCNRVFKGGFIGFRIINPGVKIDVEIEQNEIFSNLGFIEGGLFLFYFID